MEIKIDGKIYNVLLDYCAEYACSLVNHTKAFCTAALNVLSHHVPPQGRGVVHQTTCTCILNIDVIIFVGVLC